MSDTVFRTKHSISRPCPSDLVGVLLNKPADVFHPHKHILPGLAAIRPHVGGVVIANPRQVRLIAEARIKTDVIDATVLARLYASGFLPEVWIPDEATLGLRRQITRWTQIVRRRT